MFYKSISLQVHVLQVHVLQVHVLHVLHVLQVHVLQVHVLQVQSIVYKSSPVQGPVHVLQHAGVQMLSDVYNLELNYTIMINYSIAT